MEQESKHNKINCEQEWEQEWKQEWKQEWSKNVRTWLQCMQEYYYHYMEDTKTIELWFRCHLSMFLEEFKDAPSLPDPHDLQTHHIIYYRDQDNVKRKVDSFGMVIWLASLCYIESTPDLGQNWFELAFRLPDAPKIGIKYFIKQ